MKEFLKVKDHSVSGETFALLHDENLDLLITSPAPDEASLGKYYESDDYISHTDGKRTLFEKLYHVIKGIALKQKISLVNRHATIKGNLLDLGAGTGEFLMTAKQKGWSVVGVEPSEKARSIASTKNIELITSTSTLAENSFDVITMWHVLEHVPGYNQQIIELKRLLKPDGVLIVAVPNFNSFDAKYYKEFWAAFDVPRHLFHFSKTAIRKIFESHDMKLEKILPMRFDAFYVSLLSERYKNGKMNFLKAFQIGWKSNRRAKRNFEYSSHIYVLKFDQNAK